MLRKPRSQRGAAYGLCTAYCAAMDCDSEAPQASETGCSRAVAAQGVVCEQPE